MLKLAIRRVRPEKEQQLRSWLAELMRRSEEVRETLAQETVRHEQAFLLGTTEGPILIYAIEAEDHEKGQEAYQNSSLPIDIEHRKIMQEVLEGSAEAELLYECSL